jgi:hypothetical protein
MQDAGLLQPHEGKHDGIPVCTARSDRPCARRFGNGLARIATLASLSDGVYAALSASYTYDPNDRLKTVARSGDIQSLAGDKSGNRTSHGRAGVTQTYSTAAPSNRLASLAGGTARTLTYSALGNLSQDARSDGTRKYIYEGLNWLSERIWAAPSRARTPAIR